MRSLWSRFLWMGFRQTWRKPFQVEVSTEHGAPANGNVIDQLSLEISLEHRRVFFFFFFFFLF